ncbi:hypothetical protein [Rhodoferax sp.]|uniref:hypothetical protein n=1 Tax=Rhodoferax sp. TaxID=50421 RepID=UPI002ACDBD23|nr:hypothetical protein [Rhodoferax sp.]MDZ7918494.1 hypothetical protein [Rhodoferax sp.]
MNKTALIALVASTLTGCSMTLPIRGQMQNSDETFTGVATGYLDGGGDLKIVSNKGVTCQGNFVYVTDRQGRGIFTCDDKRTGPFEFVSTGRRGTGTGEMSNGDRLIFTFGN